MSERINLMTEGGKAKPSPQMAQSLGPKKINIQRVIEEINTKTKDLQGLKIPVEIEIDEKNNYIITLGTPPISELIKKEISLEKGSGEPNKNKIANLAIEQIIKLAKMKQESMLVNNLKSAVKSVAGSCNSAGILIEGKNSREINKLIDEGYFDKEINESKTEVSKDKKVRLEKELKETQEAIKKVLEKEKAEKEAEEEKKKKKEEAAVEEVKEEAKTEAKAEAKTEAKTEAKVEIKEKK